jgi:hypothetical protein
MGVTKYPVLDDDFHIKMLGCCSDGEERGLKQSVSVTYIDRESIY